MIFECMNLKYLFIQELLNNEVRCIAERISRGKTHHFRTCKNWLLITLGKNPHFRKVTVLNRRSPCSFSLNEKYNC